MNDIETYRQSLEEMLRLAGTTAREMFGKAGTLYSKTSASDVVTEADLKINDTIIATIQKRFPEHGVISEERPASGGSEFRWIIDPLDGTFNFSRATPLFGTMIALARNDQIILGGTVLPAFDELYIAWQGGGTWKNGQRVSCSQQSSLADSYGCGYARLSKERAPTMRQLLKLSEQYPIWISSFGTAAMSAAYVADGRRDWYHSTGGGVWDYAASSIILTEAGCRVTDLEGHDWTINSKHIVAANPKLHPEFLALLQGRTA